MSITSANAVLMFSIAGLFDVPQQIEQFAVDDIYSVDNIPASDAVMGVDGFMSAGFVYALTTQTIALQADSVSNSMFEHWALQQRAVRDVYLAFATITLPSINRKYSMIRGALQSYPPLPAAGRVLAARRYTIAWEAVEPANLA